MEEELRPRKKGTPNLKLKYEREKRFWTLEDVSARISGLEDFGPGEPDPRTVGRWERGISFPSPRYCRALCTIFELDAQSLGLLQGDNEESDTELSEQAPTIADIAIPQTPLMSTEPHILTPILAIQQQQSGHHLIPTRQDQKPLSPSPAYHQGSPLAYRARLALLKHLRSLWISQVLTQSLQYAPSLPLTLRTRPDLVTNPWPGAIQESLQQSQMMPRGTSLHQLFQARNGPLLLLGPAGGGKTILLLELLRTLLDRAEVDQNQPIPILLTLAEWQTPHRSFIQWLLRELAHKYQISRPIATEWLHNNQMVLILDSLDEVTSRAYQNCIHQINKHLRIYPLTSLVISSRSADHLARSQPLHVQQIVQIEPPLPGTIRRYLANNTPQFRAINTLFQQVPLIQSFVTTPFRLSILAQAWQEMTEDELQQAWKDGSAQQKLCAIYIERALNRRKAHPNYSSQHTCDQLRQMAQFMQIHQQHIFVPPSQPRGLPFLRFLQKQPPFWQQWQFLDYAVERLLLRKEEAGYAFVHTWLRAYFSEHR